MGAQIVTYAFGCLSALSVYFLLNDILVGYARLEHGGSIPFVGISSFCPSDAVAEFYE